MIIIGAMVASILSILVIKPFDKGGGKSETPPHRSSSSRSRSDELEGRLRLPA
ncbi:hypothetical protein ACC688_24780 [Rhizobium ruizarguesonis]|nr:hypothetical protein [Rhizobium ruizarguesonis]